ncbi:hypothetical protein C8J57DRAFT_1262517 [Mycena rebaudengoi]|nr:hypothetical protein C8J57DRAFT_1262517 [Mycena rebaudengoi]
MCWECARKDARWKRRNSGIRDLYTELRPGEVKTREDVVGGRKKHGSDLIQDCLSLHPPGAAGAPDADSLIDPDPLKRTPSHLLNPEYLYIPLFAHPHNLSVHILNGFLSHHAMLLEGYYIRHVCRPNELHRPMPVSWQWMGVRSTSETIFVEPTPFVNQPEGAAYPPTHSNYVYLINNYWTSIPLTSEIRGEDAMFVFLPPRIVLFLISFHSTRLSQHSTDHPYIVQAPAREHPAARPVVEYNGDWASISAVEAFRLRHNLPGPEAPPHVPFRFDSPSLIDDTSDSPDSVSDYISDCAPVDVPPSSPGPQGSQTLRGHTCTQDTLDDVEDADDSNESDQLSQDEDDDEDQPLTPPQPPRSPPPPPLICATRPPTPFPSPPLLPMPRCLIAEPLHAIGLCITGIPLPPPSPPVPKGHLNTLVGVICLCLAFPTDGPLQDEYPPAPPSSLVSLTQGEDGQDHSHPIVLHVRLRPLTSMRHGGDGSETP